MGVQGCGIKTLKAMEKIPYYIYAGIPAIDQIKYQVNILGNGSIFNTIAVRVFTEFNVSMEHLCSLYRGRDAVEARQVAMYIIHKKTPASLKSIGSFFGRDHSTIIYGCQTVEDLMFTNKVFKSRVAKLLD